MDDFSSQRRKMVHDQLEIRGLRDERLLSAFQVVPRHLFVPFEYRVYAYDDSPLPIGFNQTISQPYIVGFMIELLELTGIERVLEIGTGSGYQAAILACLSKEVHTIEIIPDLYNAAENRLLGLGYTNVFCHHGDGSPGWSISAPYDGIIVAAAAPTVPGILLDQLQEGGRLVLPVGGRDYQEIFILRKTEKTFKLRKSIGVAFVPLRGEWGWK